MSASGGIMVMGGYIGYAAIFAIGMNLLFIATLTLFLLVWRRSSRRLLNEQGKLLSAMLELIKRDCE